MLQNREPLIEICEVLAEREELKVTCKLAAKDALIAGFGAFAGALIAGPIGVAVGGTAASIATALNSRGKYRSVVDILRYDLTPTQQAKLTEAVKKAVNNVNVDDVAMLMTIVLTSTTLKEAILKELASFLLKELNLNMLSQI
ncbi:protein C19orf12 homolog isoform X2 [Anoplophora glabripennis]|uniref:protein C19orf12 homolog isoform X2 n=1 Tax=Anoplophora glabripennis TaxID=217634 RepID=UPI00087537C4|nr:protein C19orf12 homolog isoform X2 [Anoplophora glabripennis]